MCASEKILHGFYLYTKNDEHTVAVQRPHDDTIMANLHWSAWTVVIVSQEDRSLLWLSFFLANFGDKIINVLSSGGVSDIPLFLYSDHWYSKVGLILIV